MAALTADMLKTRSGQFDLESIQRVSVARMALGSTDVLKRCTSLVSLDLSGNMLTSATQLGLLPKLRTLDLSSNRLATLDGFEGLAGLEHLKLEGNGIGDLAELSKLACLTNLRSLSLRSRDHKRSNPAQTTASNVNPTLPSPDEGALFGAACLDTPVCSHPTYFTQVQRVLGSFKLQQVDGENLLLRETAQKLMLENAEPEEGDITLPPAEPWNHERLLRLPAKRKDAEVLELETDLSTLEDEAKALDAEAAVLLSKVRADAAARVKEAKAKMAADAEKEARKKGNKVSSTRRAEPNR